MGVAPSPGEAATGRALVAGVDYPRSYREFVEWFPDAAARSAYPERLRWPEGFVCPAGGIAAAPWRQIRGRLVRRLCRRQMTVTVGTILDKTRTPLTTWLEAAWHVTTARNGMSAKTLERTLGVSYRVAWTKLQRYRLAMVVEGQCKCPPWGPRGQRNCPPLGQANCPVWRGVGQAS
jgi:hypothetical protein